MTFQTCIHPLALDIRCQCSKHQGQQSANDCALLANGSMFNKLVTCDSPTSAQHTSRPPGRPKTRTAAHYAALLLEYGHLATWFAETFGRRPQSDAELMTAHITAALKQRGMRESRATSPDMKRKLKTLRNELSTARRLVQPNPENQLLPGRVGVDSSDMQTRVLTNKDSFYAR